eukprot:360433-Chlamydomonas_euryale.AAC.4
MMPCMQCRGCASVRSVTLDSNGADATQVSVRSVTLDSNGADATQASVKGQCQSHREQKCVCVCLAKQALADQNVGMAGIDRMQCIQGWLVCHSAAKESGLLG